jgi:hypothetical protein
MSLSNEALQKVCGVQWDPNLWAKDHNHVDSPQLAREIETQAAAAQQQIGLARTQMAAKQREQRLLRLTLGELDTLPQDAVIYEGVGKMWAIMW